MTQETAAVSHAPPSCSAPQSAPPGYGVAHAAPGETCQHSQQPSGADTPATHAPPPHTDGFPPVACWRRQDLPLWSGPPRCLVPSLRPPLFVGGHPAALAVSGVPRTPPQTAL